MIDNMTFAQRERLTAAIKHGAPHLAPIYEAVRDGGVCFGIVTQKMGPFAAPDAGQAFSCSATTSMKR